MLKGRTIDLRRIEREDLTVANEWFNDPDFRGALEGFPWQRLRSEREKELFEPKFTDADFTPFMVLRKDGTAIGWAFHELIVPYEWVVLGYHLLPGDRGKGYGTEVVQILVDYLFLTRDIDRIQATTHMANKASQRVLEKAGFKLEGVIRRGAARVNGVPGDFKFYGILREEWKGPRILAEARLPVTSPTSGVDK